MNNIRELVQHLERSGRITHIRKEVDPVFEVGAVIKTGKGKQPFYFEKIKGYNMPMVSGLGGDRDLLAETMGITKDRLLEKLIDSIVHPIKTRKVASGPVHENVVLRPKRVTDYFPVCTYHKDDSGAYLVSGILVVKDRSGRRRYTSIRRMQMLEGNRSSVLISSPELHRQFLESEQRGEPMEVAVMFGVVPAVVLASQISTHLYHCDKLDVAGALLGTPLDVVQCRTVDLEVLAEAEVVLEGKILPHVREPEGPFGELGGYYGDCTPQPVIEFTAITHRNEPIWQTIYPSSHEEHLPMALAREATLLSTVRQVVPEVLNVHLTVGGIGRYHAVISIRKRSEGDAKQALLAAFASDKDLKHVVVVDEDVNLFDPQDVEWAIATRVQADLDVFIVPGAKGSPLEPSHQLRGVSAKMGIDATYPIAAKESYRRTSIPVAPDFNIQDYL
ncbi:UbiD family decarboxylase [Paenibacillus sp. HN-1]|uniref:UbiD family decarboxylase n=1 Tax=Paenibacillus TaxID=44249 RepID=UPI001CAA0659|nr:MULTISPECIES: UbiD family decarboxylase [Paenibacillus]MBY9081383.1 UbiD family decarboxylase [Paenibacillus sp. CGMCC 1.18879]MBY9084903.1 UbiD family decarboxylase [Paenibacillus sinensis]